MPILKQFVKKSVSIPNETAQNKEISIEALGALTRMLSYSQNYKFKVEWLQINWDKGRDKVRQILRELKDAGYMQIIPSQTNAGKFNGQEWHISNQPIFTEQLENRPTEKPSHGKTEGRQISSAFKKEEILKKNGNGIKKGERGREKPPHKNPNNFVSKPQDIPSEDDSELRAVAQSCEALEFFENTFQIKTKAMFANEVFETVKDLMLWKQLCREKINFADKPKSQRERIPNWFLSAYNEKVERNGTNKPNGGNRYPTKRTDDDIWQEAADLLGYSEQ